MYANESIHYPKTLTNKRFNMKKFDQFMMNVFIPGSIAFGVIGYIVLVITK
jgi:hypothetical protein